MGEPRNVGGLKEEIARFLHNTRTTLRKRRNEPNALVDFFDAELLACGRRCSLALPRQSASRTSRQREKSSASTKPGCPPAGDARD